MWRRYGLGQMVLLAANAAALAWSCNTVADEWPWYGHDPGGTRYSPLTQINRENVSTLKVAWTFHTGEISDMAGRLVLWNRRGRA